ncbi:MAG TPA: hypothetical protein VMC42_00670 [Methanoregulaceae archaeon]|nr:hypothetical protein [Methanoregulaceae archaeon]
MKKGKIGIITLIIVTVLIGFTFTVCADRNVPAVPEIQGLTTGTSADVVGTVTETDAGAWSTTYDPPTIIPGSPDLNTFNSDITGGIDGTYISSDSTTFQEVVNTIQSQGGSITYFDNSGGNYYVTQVVLPTSLLTQSVPSGFAGFPHQFTSYGDFGEYVINRDTTTPPPIVTAGTPATVINHGLHTGVLDPGQIQYTTGYNDQYSGISGQQTFTKSMAVSTGNTIADQSNIKANTNIQYIAADTGRATRTEDLLLDGAANSTDTASAILCPFAQSVSTVIPPYCNIVQAGSAFDTTLTSTVTSADTRFVGTDSTFPVVLNYNINSQGITLDSGSSPMIGSVSAYLKVHVQEARNNTTTKSEDLVYSETSTASGLISKFSKNMQYQSGFNLV